MGTALIQVGTPVIKDDSASVETTLRAPSMAVDQPSSVTVIKAYFSHVGKEWKLIRHSVSFFDRWP